MVENTKKTDHTVAGHFGALESACDVDLLYLLSAMFDGRHPQVCLGTLAVLAVNICAQSREHMRNPNDVPPGKILGSYILQKHEHVFEMLKRSRVIGETKGEA